MNAQQLRQGQDVIFVTSNQDKYPAKLIRETGHQAWNICVFNDSGVKIEKNIAYSETPQPNHFLVPQEQEQSRGVGSQR